MKYIFQLSDFPNAVFEMENSIWTGKSKLSMNGSILEQLKEKGKPFLIPTSEKTWVKAYTKTALPDFVPKLEINGVINEIAKKLPWYQYVLGGLPILLLFMGGFIGGIIGAFAAITNFHVFRQEESDLIKYIKVIAISAIAYTLFIYATSAFLQLIS